MASTCPSCGECAYRKCGEGARRVNGALVHGIHTDEGEPEGCGIECHLAGQWYRCAECGVGFCRDCIRKHFTKSGA